VGTLIAAAILAAVALALVALVMWPLVVRSPDEAPADPSEAARKAIDEDLQRSLAAVKEIEMDHRAGNLSDEDFAALDRAERARALELMRRRDELGGRPAPASPSGDAGAQPGAGAGR
jgi:hypothetical protein